MKDPKIPIRKSVKNTLLTAFGLVCVCLGIIGIFLPILPTTPFILLAAWLFARSSERFHRWLSEHPRFGPMLAMWGENKQIDKAIRNRALFFMWAGMGLSMLIVAKLWAVVMLSIIGLSVTIYICRITAKPISENV